MISELLTPRILELGKIKLGGLGQERTSKSGAKYRLPEKYDHFVITTMNRTPKGDLVQDGRLMEELVKKCGDADGKLRRIPIFLLSDDFDQVLQAAWVWYASKKCIARCEDGKTIIWSDPNGPNATNWRNKFGGDSWEPSFAEIKDAKKNRTFKFHACLNCVVASSEGRWGGVYKMRTSMISGQQLFDSLTNIATLTGGFLRGIPMWLVLRPLVVTPKEMDGGSTTVYVVHCELHGADLLSVQQNALKIAEAQQKHTLRIRAITSEYQKLLSSPGEDESDEEQELIQEEFAPERNGHAQKAASVASGDDPLMDGISEPDFPATPGNGANSAGPKADAAPAGVDRDEAYAELSHRINQLPAGDHEGAKLIADDLSRAKPIIGEEEWMNLNDRLTDRVRESEFVDEPPY